MKSLIIIGLILFVVALLLTIIVVIRAFSELKVIRIDETCSQVLLNKMNKFVRKDVK